MDDDVKRMWKVTRTLHEMLVDRGFLEILSGENASTLEDFLSKHVTYSLVDRGSLQTVAFNRERNACILVHFFVDPSISVKHIEKIQEKLLSGKITHCILVYPKAITSQTKKYIESTRSRFSIELFSEEDLLVNVTRHKMMPEHTLMTSEEKSKFLKASCLVIEQLPRILVSDPVCRYYGAKRGDIMRIIRKSETAGKYAMFRLCN
jgi:DNA-directed RNA polymerase I, II, and III subunit RPABC1